MQRRGVAGTDENARADDAADAEEHKVPRPERPLELAGACFFLDLGDALAHHDAPEQSLRSGSRHYFPLKVAFCLPRTLAASFLVAIPLQHMTCAVAIAPASGRAVVHRTDGRGGAALPARRACRRC